MYDSTRSPQGSGIERAMTHLDDMDHYLRDSSKSKSFSPAKSPSKVIDEPRKEEEGPATEEEKKEGVKQLLALLRSQKKTKAAAADAPSDEAGEKPKKKKGKKKLIMKDGNLIIMSVDDDDDGQAAKNAAEEKKQELLKRIVALAEEGNFAEVDPDPHMPLNERPCGYLHRIWQVEQITRARLAELHGTKIVRSLVKTDLLKALKTGTAEAKLLKKVLFRLSEGLTPKVRSPSPCSAVPLDRQPPVFPRVWISSWTWPTGRS
jgi:hypothetical protein